MTKFGLLTQGFTIYEDVNLLKRTDIGLMRVPVFYHNNIVNVNANILIEQGLNVALNFNYLPTNVPRVFMWDLDYIQKAAERFFTYYSNKKDHIPFVAVENEWDNPNYRDFHSTGIKNYLDILKAVTEIGHKYGFKIADAGITMAGLTSWHYVHLSGKDAKDWKRRYNVSIKNKDFSKYIDIIEGFIDGSKNIDFDYLNFHWYNGKPEHFGGLKEAIDAYKKACGKSAILTNEFGVRNDASLWPSTVNEIKSVTPEYAIAYSGTNKKGKAIQLTEQNLKLLK